MIDPESWGRLLEGLVVSLQVCGVSLLFGLPLGVVFALLADSRSLPLRYISIAIVEIGRGAPTLLLLGLLYYGMPQYGITLDSWIASVIAITYATGAYTAEIFRSSLGAVPRGQRDAARSIGLSRWDGFRDVVAPQGVRIAIPQLVSFSILVLQATALCYSVALPELLSAAYQAGSATFNYPLYLGSAAFLYIVVSVPVARLAGWLEARQSARL